MTAARATTFSGFDPYKLTGVRVTDRELGYGSYATVLELEYMERKCAGKKIHTGVFNDASCVRRFEEECRLLSQVHHPNIVQFLGVYFEQGVQAPILVMEFLPTNLTSCIEQHGILPKEISYSILHDVALGLRYLHSQTPLIIHRDLSSNNILLATNMTAKISDLGMAKIFDPPPGTSQDLMAMTTNPGTDMFMPPEVKQFNRPEYGPSVDTFSYGIIMIHVFSGQLPKPQDPNVGKEVTVSEAERRAVFLEIIETNHSLMSLILKCIDNDSRSRPHVSEIVGQLRMEYMKQFPTSFSNLLDKAFEIVAEENKELREENRTLKEGNRTLKEEIQELATKNAGDLRGNVFSFQDKIIWQPYARLPAALAVRRTAVINGKVYLRLECDYIIQEHDDDVAVEYTAYCYDSSQHMWTTLPPLPVRYFGLGQVNGKLVAIGGEKSNGHTKSVANEVYTYDEQSQKWDQTIPPMPTARFSPGILSLQSALIVAGGYGVIKKRPCCLATVEIFKLNESQWYSGEPLLVDCVNISLVASGNTCYALGGYGGSSFNQALYASVDDLLGNAVPANQTTHCSSSYTQSIWRALSNTPTYEPAAAVLAGNLLAIGGIETPRGGAAKKEVYMYSPSTNSWIYISDLPALRAYTAAAALSLTEILVIGGWDGLPRSTLFKGTYMLEQR